MTRTELIAQIREKESFLCVGLDPDIKKIPQCVIDECKADLDDGGMLHPTPRRWQ